VLFKLLKKYSPEDKKQRRSRLVAEAKAKAESTSHVILENTTQKARPFHLKFGLNHVTKLIEERKAKLVVIANNVDPIELVVWLPALCRKMDIPYCFVRGKAKLGQLVHQKNAAVVALTEIRKEDEGDLTNLTTAFRTNFNDNVQMRKEIGGFKKGAKSQIKYDKISAEREREAIQKLQ
jgi:large subunit ribosomal protein L7Ae